jgi:fimbrial chaperone protein
LSPNSKSSRASALPTHFKLLLSALLLLAGLQSSLASAQFAAYVIPARFELTSRPGNIVKEVLEIGNDDIRGADYSVKTADWILKDDAGVDFNTEALAPDSCRPWVRLERLNVRVPGKGKRRYRFEVHVPADAKPGLCRFAVMLEATDASVPAQIGNIQLPILGRIGVIVYLRIGDAKPALNLEGIETRMVNGRVTPVALFRNTGNAHARPEGILSGIDAKGSSLDFSVSPLPVLPGELRAIPLWVQGEAAKVGTLNFPLKLSGVLEWEGGKAKVESTLAK